MQIHHLLSRKSPNEYECPAGDGLSIGISIEILIACRPPGRWQVRKNNEILREATPECLWGRN